MKPSVSYAVAEELAEPRPLELSTPLLRSNLMLILLEKVSNGHSFEVSYCGRKLSAVDLPLLIPCPFSDIGSGGECLCNRREAFSAHLNLPGRASLADGRHSSCFRSAVTGLLRIGLLGCLGGLAFAPETQVIQGVRNGAPDTIRTCDLCLRRATLYPAELRVLYGGGPDLFPTRLAAPRQPLTRKPPERLPRPQPMHRSPDPGCFRGARAGQASLAVRCRTA